MQWGHCSLCVCVCFACTVRMLHMADMCVGQTHKGARKIDRVRVNGCKWDLHGWYRL